MGKWNKIELGAVCKLKGGFAFKSNDFQIEGIPLVKISNIQNNKTVKSNSDVFINEKYLETHKNFILKENNVVIAMSGATTGKIGKVNEPFCPSLLNQRVGLFQPKDDTKVDMELIYQIFSQDTLIQHILGNAGSSAQPNISPSFIEGIEINLPESKPEQTRIAEILSTADDAIALTEALIAKYQRIKTGLMQDLLTKGIDENGNIRSKATHKFVVKNGIEVPEEWAVEQIEHHCIHSAFGPRFSGSLYSLSGNIGTLRTTDLDIEGNINYKTIPFANLNIKDFESHLLMEDDLLITRSGTVGVVSVFKKQTFNVIPGAFLIRFRLKSSILPEFLRFYFRNEIGKRKLLDIAEGGVQKNIRGSSVLKLFVPIPNPDEQKEINKRLSQIENLIQDQDNLLNKFQSLKIGLMQDLLSGKERVKLN